MLRKSDAKDHIVAHLHFGVGSCALEVRDMVVPVISSADWNGDDENKGLQLVE